MLPVPCYLGRPGACLLGVQGVQARDDAVGGRAELIIARARAERAELHLRAPPAPLSAARWPLAPGPGGVARPCTCARRTQPPARPPARCGPLDRPHMLARTPCARPVSSQAG